MAAAFSLGGFLSSFYLGHLSDHRGRKPILTLGVVSCTVLLMLFGFSPNVEVAVANRFMEGLLNANLPGVAPHTPVPHPRTHVPVVLPRALCVRRVPCAALGRR